jgi:hypothetical protein
LAGLNTKSDMPLLFWAVPLIAAGGVMWFAANQTAPIGQKIPLARAIITIVLMGVATGACVLWLKPVFGGWGMLVALVADILAVMVILQLSFWRALRAVIIYSVAMAIVVMGLYYLTTLG